MREKKDKKVCSCCKKEKNVIEYAKNRSLKDGLASECKICKNIIAKELRQKYSRLEIREIKDRKVCGWCKREKTILEYAKNKYHKDGFDSECKACKRKYNNAYFKTRKLYDPEFKLLINMRARLGNVLKRKSKSQTTRQLIGVDFEIFTKWIEYQFEEGMTLQNYGSAWHHDHVLPISSFNVLDEEELQKAMNWVNIRPMLPVKNIQKSNKIDHWLNVMQQVKAHYFIKHLNEI